MGKKLACFRKQALSIPDEELRRQAVASIDAKAFHCMGGSVYALLNPAKLEDLVKAIVAIQTISDYLDNLCDRVQISGKDAAYTFSSFMRLHESFLCAVDPNRPICEFYSLYPLSDDGGYLRGLVDTSRTVLSSIDDYPAVKQTVLKLAQMYAELQSIKHLSSDIRVEWMEKWFLKYKEQLADQKSFAVGDLKWWEFGAATGSTLGLFCLIAYSSRGIERGLAKRAVNAYFPDICGLHILLDYFIDQKEDKEFGDLNFFSSYLSVAQGLDRLKTFIIRAFKSAEGLEDPWLHKAVVNGLLAMYLSDPKTADGRLSCMTAELISCGKGNTGFLQAVCRLVRKMSKF